MSIFPGDVECFRGSVEIISCIKMDAVWIISSDKGSIIDTDPDCTCAVFLCQKCSTLFRWNLFHKESRNPQGTVFVIASKDQDFI
nr:hypothetical protein [uncultured Sellimonas sp.]